MFLRGVVYHDLWVTFSFIPDYWLPLSFVSMATTLGKSWTRWVLFLLGTLDAEVNSGSLCGLR